jgi:hypothetical protein
MDRTPPGRVRGLQLSDSELGLGPGLTWDDPVENGSGVVSFRVSLDKGPQLVVPHDPEGSNAFSLEGLRAGSHMVKIVAVDRAGNRGRPATIRFRTS